MDVRIELVRERLVYETSTGFLRWKINRGHVLAGAVAGSLTRVNGRPCAIIVGFNRQFNSAHRIIWRLHNGEISTGMVIDHIDGNPTNNRLENLRMVSQAINSRNMCLKRNNTSGHVGVWWDKSKRKWAAECMVNRKKVFIGRYDRIEDAVEARQTAQVQYGFHPNHGRVVQLEAA